MIDLHRLEAYCNQLLNAQAFSDYCPNGIQVEAGDRIRRLVTGVTASRALIEATVAEGAECLLVHHGYFWKGEPAALRGVKGDRVGRLFRHGISLIAYHLPLDAHPELGNNAQLGRCLGIAGGAPLGEDPLLWGADLSEAVSPGLICERIAAALDRAPLHIDGGPARIRRLAWCTGAAQSMIESAAEHGVDAFITGEVSEPTVHLARERGLHFYAAGHHATERYGVQALGTRLAEQFGLEHRFIDVPNPV
jgi:dinuclear metal center YbgI/SA1388 family protein